jgi:hypothetical protein
MGLKKCIYSTYSSLNSTHLWLRCPNFFDPSKKNYFGCAANRKVGNRQRQRLISTPMYKSAELLLLLLCFAILLFIIIVYLFFIWDLFNDAVSGPDYIFSHGTMVSGGSVRKWSWCNLRYICLEGLRNTTKTSVRVTGIPVEIQTRHLMNILLLLGPTWLTSLQSFVVIVLTLWNPKSI